MEVVEEKYVTIEDVAKHYSVSISTVRAWMRNDIIPTLKIANVYRFKLSAVDAALKTYSENKEKQEQQKDPRQLELDLNPDKDL
jgi:excisionase family DNA binding protein